jgi:hypothetical protein
VERVWYVAYGSNLALGRFRCYLAGGRPLGGLREYAGSRDHRDPERIVSLEVRGGLVFAGESRVWTGGMAFFDAEGTGLVACRAYLVTTDQFADVVAQEMRRPPGGEFARALSEVAPSVETVHEMGPGRYETITRVAVRNGVPMLTMTHGDASTLDPAAPSAAYLGWIAAGLRESHGWDGEQIAAYLAAAPGVKGAWSQDELAGIAA